jgi:ornithine cyclodeaminase/alanine dehydrogenase-like protein (mu-crystallin family)
MVPSGTLLLSRHDVAELLTLERCIGAVEAAFAAHARGETLGSGVLGLHVPGGGFHIKAAGLNAPALFAAKVNANFAANESRFGLPRIQGLIVLSDATHGYPLAVMDSAEITALRTAAATAVAARHLARKDAHTAAIIGCGRQSQLQLRAVALVRTITRAVACDVDRDRAARFAREMSSLLKIPIAVIDDPAGAARQSDIVVTCTSATGIVLRAGDVQPGAFVAAVGADSDTKQEIDPAFMAASAVVPDLLEQAATIGDLHHALVTGAMTKQMVRAELGAVVAGLAEGRRDEREVVIFDSTGTAIQDVAAAAVVYERAIARGRGVRADLLNGRTSLETNPAFRVFM